MNNELDDVVEQEEDIADLCDSLWLNLPDIMSLGDDDEE